MKETKTLEDNQKIINYLKKLPVLEMLKLEDLQILLKMSRLRTYKNGEVIIEEGDVDYWMYFLVYGKVIISQKGKKVTTIQRKGSIFGEMRYIDSAPRSATAYSEGETVCIAVDTDELDKLTGENKVAFGYVLYRIFVEVLAERLRIATQELMELKGKEGIKIWKR